VNLSSRKSFASDNQNLGALIVLLTVRPARQQVRYVMLYEVIVSTTLAMVLLPFNFWVAAALVLLAGLVTTASELHRSFADVTHQTDWATTL